MLAGVGRHCSLANGSLSHKLVLAVFGELDDRGLTRDLRVRKVRLDVKLLAGVAL